MQTALQVLGDESLAMTCVDISDAAIENAKQRFPTVTGIVSDATSIPLDDGSFDIVTSQFGVEYAGTDAVTEAARLDAPGGALGFLMHIENGSVHKECQDSLAAIDALRETNFVALAIELFRNGFAAVKGADRTPYDAAGSQFAPAVAAAEKIMNDFGTDVAGGTIAPRNGGCHRDWFCPFLVKERFSDLVGCLFFVLDGIDVSFARHLIGDNTSQSVS